MKKTIMTLCGIAAVTVAAALVGYEATADELAPSPEFVNTWFLVRLQEPLSIRESDGSYALATGFPGLDALITESAVHRIDSALPVSDHSPRFPRSFRRHGLDRTYRFHVPEGSDVIDMVGKFSLLAEVEYTEPDPIHRIDAVFPNDPQFPDQWGYDQSSDADTDGPEAWEITTGSDIVLAILDTGIDSDHEDLTGKILPGYDFVNNDADPEDDNGHGTRVASIAAASTDNGRGIAGGCWNCRLLPVKVLSASGSASAARFADGVVWATDNGARVINYSASGSIPSAIHLSAINYAYDAGVVLVGGVGNDDAYGVLYPKARAEFIASGGTDSGDRRAAPYSCSGTGGSRYGKEVDVVAPADSIPAANRGGGYVNVCGNSFSGPGLAGLVGLIETIAPSYGREEVRHLLRSGAEDEVGRLTEDTQGFDIYHGWGRVNMERTLLATESSMSLRVQGKAATRVFLASANPVAISYDFVRGDLSALSESAEGGDLGTVVCLENDSPDADTLGSEDLETPGPGQAFFYLSRFNAAPGSGSYGGSTRNRDRKVFSLTSPRWSVEGGQVGARLGTSVGTAGDVNNDGYDDVIVGGDLYSGDLPDEGVALVYLGSASGSETSPVWTGEGDQIGAAFGGSVASAGDVNGDGYGDVIVGARLHDNGETDGGRAYLYPGSASGPATTPSWTAEGDQAGAQFGGAVASAGDVNNDGYADVVVGAPRYDGSGGPPGDRPDRGRAFLYRGSASGLATTPTWTVEGDQAGGQFGWSVASAGDVNSDGYSDVIVGAPFYDSGETDEGRAHLYLGSASGLATTPSWTAEGNQAGAQFGSKVATAGDVDNDGFDDLIVGARRFTGGETEEGAVYVFSGSSSGAGTDPVWSFEGDQFYAGLGIAAETAGDVNNDGYADVIVGSELHDVHRSDEGQALVFHGSALGLSTTPDWSAALGRPVAGFGWSVATAGDVDDDGYGDVIVGARFYANGETDEGAAFLYRGSVLGVEDPAPTSDCDR